MKPKSSVPLDRIKDGPSIRPGPEDLLYCSVVRDQSARTAETLS